MIASELMDANTQLNQFNMIFEMNNMSIEIMYSTPVSWMCVLLNCIMFVQCSLFNGFYFRVSLDENATPIILWYVY